MISVDSAAIVALLVIGSIMTLILIWILIYVHQQSNKVDDIRRQLDLLNQPKSIKKPTAKNKETTR